VDRAHDAGREVAHERDGIASMVLALIRTFSTSRRSGQPDARATRRNSRSTSPRGDTEVVADVLEEERHPVSRFTISRFAQTMIISAVRGSGIS
jgi:hypothetical protein